MCDTVDPEMKEEFDKMSSKSPMTGKDGAANQIQNFDLAGWMAGGNKGGSGGSGSGGGKKK